MESLNFKAFDWAERDVLNSRLATNGDPIKDITRQLGIFAHSNIDSELCYIRFEDFPIKCVIELPSDITWNVKSVEGLIARIKTIKLPGNVLVHQLLAGDVTYEITRGLHGYLEGDKYFIVLHFKSNAGMYAVKTKLESPIYVDGRGILLRLCESEVDSIRKFTIERKLLYADWFKCSVTLIQDEEDKISRCEREYLCEMNNIWPIDTSESANLVVYPVMAATDIETQSANLISFPDAYLKKCEISMISVDISRIGKSDYKKYCITTGVTIQQKDIIMIYVENEIELLKALMQLYIDNKVDIISGHNILGYDFNYMEIRRKILMTEWLASVSRFKDVNPTFKDESWSSSNTNKMDVKYIEIPGRIYVDTYHVCKGMSMLRLPNHKLDTISKEVLGHGKRDVTPKEMFAAFDEHKTAKTIMEKCTKGIDDSGKPLKHDNVSRPAWRAIVKRYLASCKRLGTVVEYCVVDSELVRMLFAKLNIWETVMQFSNILQIRTKHVYTVGQQKKGLSQLFALLKEFNVVLNTIDVEVSKEKYEGALNLGTKLKKVGMFMRVISGDINSMYPSIISANNLCTSTELTPKLLELLKLLPEDYIHHKWCDWENTDREMEYDLRFVKPHIHRGFFPILVDRLKSKRSAVKKEMELHIGTPTYAILNAKQEALKVSANSIYGMLGSSKNPKVPAKHIAALVTKIGRDALLSIMAFVQHGGNPNEPPKYPKGVVVYGDTDSIQFYFTDEEVIKWQGKPFVTPQEVLDFGHEFVASICDYITPLRIELEKFGDMILMGPKRYVFHLMHHEKKDRDGNANSKYGQWKKYSYTGVEYVKRNQTPALKRMYSSITELIMDQDYRVDIDNKDEREKLRLQQVIDTVFQYTINTLGKKFPIEDYVIYEAYNTESTTTAMSTLVNRMAEAGKPILLGERVPFVYVKWPGIASNTSKGAQMRLLDDVVLPEELNVELYVERTIASIDALVSARYAKDTLMERFMNSKNITKFITPILERKTNIKYSTKEDILKDYYDSIHGKIAKSKNVSLLPVAIPETMEDLMTIKHSEEYDSYPGKVKTMITGAINRTNKIGYPLLLPNPTFVTNILLADKLGILREYTKCIVSPSVSSSIC